MSKHEKINIKVQCPLVLEDSDKVWMVLNGDVNVFSTFTKVFVFSDKR